MFLKQSTAYTFRMGPFLDETDGKTAETGLTISQADVRLSKGGGNFAQKNESSASLHDEIGYYIVVLNATDTATVGELLIAVHESGALPVFKTFQVVEEAIYDAIYGGSADLITKVDAIDTVVDAILVDTGTTLDTKINTIDTVVDSILVDTAVIGSAGAGLTAVPWNAAWDAEVQSEVADGLAAYDPPTKAELDSAFTEIKGGSWASTDTLEAIRDRGDAAWTTGGGGSAPTAAAVADAVWDEATSGHTTSGTFGEQVKTDIDAILVDTGTTLDGKIDTIDGIVDSILVDTGTTLNDKIDVVDGIVDSILVDTGTTLDGKLNTIDGIVDAILVDTAVIGSAGAGLSGVPWNSSWDAEVQSEVADALAAYDPPTKAEMDAMWTTAATESYASDGAAATPAQLMYMILCAVSEFSISSTTITGKKLDGSTTAMTWTLNDATSPTSRTRAS